MPCYDSRSGDCSEEIERLHAATRAACEMAKKLSVKQRFALSDETREWIRKHDEMDKERIAREKAAADRREAQNAALKKLTPPERRLLGLADKE